MIADMATKIRLVLVVDEEVRAALRLEASRRTAALTDEGEVTMSDVMEDLVRDGLAETVAEVRRIRAAGGDVKRRRGKGE